MQLLPILCIVFLLNLSGCSTHHTSVENNPSSPLPVPSTFTGRLPCTDCDHIDVTLNLFGNGFYQLRRTRAKGEALESNTQAGQWQYNSGDKQIILDGEEGAVGRLTLAEKNTLRIDDTKGVQGSVSGSYALTRTPDFTPLPEPVKMRGLYGHSGDTPTFTLCQGNLAFAVAREKNQNICEQMYNTIPHAQGEPLLVSIEATLVSQPDQTGTKTEFIVVDRCVEALPQQNCDGSLRRSEMFDRTWQLIELGGEPVTLAEGQRQPFFILESDGNRVRGFSGCNRFFGTYLARGEVFVFNKIAGTRMVCVKGSSLERAFLKAIEITEAYRIQDGLLELRNRNGQVLALLKSED